MSIKVISIIIWNNERKVIFTSVNSYYHNESDSILVNCRSCLCLLWPLQPIFWKQADDKKFKCLKNILVKRNTGGISLSVLTIEHL
jgi:hypothetical protein